MQKQAIINGLLIHYYAEGKGRQPLIFLHGWRSNASVWLPLFQSLVSHSYTLYALDLPGFGASETPRKPYTLRDYADIVQQFIQLIPHPSSLTPVVIGHSFGARVAIRCATDNPIKIEKLVLIASGGAREKTAGIKKIIAEVMKPLFAPRFMQPLRRKLYALIGADDYIATPHLNKTFLNIVNEDILPLCKNIKTPALIVWGEHDAVAPRAYGKKLHEVIRNSKLVILKNAGHFCFSDQPGQFIKTLRSFFNKKTA